MNLNVLRTANNLRKMHFVDYPQYGEDILYWSNATAGEAGELANLVKKLCRGDKIPNINELIADEIADVIISLDILARTLDINLSVAIIKKFNKDSLKIKSPITL